MKKTNVQLTTAGKLLKDLRRYEKKHWDLSVIAWTDDDRTFGVVGTWKDEDGDFQIVVEEIDEVVEEGIWTVADVISSMEDIGMETRVYLAGDGLYLAIDSNGGIFTKADYDDAVGCWVTVFGEYEVVEEPAPTEQEKERARKEARRKEHWKGVKGILIGTIFLLCIPLIGYGLYYNIAALVKHSLPVWQGILWIALLLFLLCICIKNLISPEHDE